ncbi:MAG: 2-hydroxyacid dehydrogenase [Propionibacteriaceae bacterium]|jgi:phosphoglycerate dehydrogenase-like enzyme|nr:2-hydroxyacid dehydrogenase [Propionibacteriaceae bacterium]
MGIKVWLPFRSVAEAERALGGFPEGIDAECFLADGNTPASVGEVRYLVAPYMSSSKAVMAAADQMASLECIQLLSAGYESFLRYLRPGVSLSNAAGVHDAGTAELAVGLALVANRDLDRYARNMSDGRWKLDFGISLADKRVLIVGYGNIGKAIERRVAGFEVASITRVASRARVEDGKAVHGVEELCELLPQADVVFIICPLTPQTERLFDKKAFQSMAKSALLVNVSRGKVVDTADLLQAVQSGQIRAALDVTDPEPLPPDHPLWRTPGVFISPHAGGQCDAMHPRSRKLMAEQLRRLAAGAPLANIVAQG